MKNYLKKIIENREKRLNELKEIVKNTEDIKAMREAMLEADSVNEELNEARNQLKTLEDGNILDVREDIPKNAVLKGNYNNTQKRNEDEDYYSSLEYRKAFMKYVQTGEWTLEERDATAGMVVTGDVGKVIPNTIMNELIKDLKVYGRLYSMVRKINVKGGVEFPIEELVPEVRWITETTVSDNQSVPEIKRSIIFGYYIAEARIAQSLLSSIVSLEVLEREIAKLLSEAFVKEFDRIIVNGTGSGQPLGILNDTRVLDTHKLTMTATELADWKSWRTKLFAKIGLAYRGRGVLIMTAETWETYMMTLTDDANRPLYQETYNITNGLQECKFAGRTVILVEPDIIKNFSEATNGEVFALYINPTDYCINSNLQIGFKRYFDEEKNKWINKGLCVMDGKLLDVNGCFTIAKSVPTTTKSKD